MAVRQTRRLVPCMAWQVGKLACARAENSGKTEHADTTNERARRKTE